MSSVLRLGVYRERIEKYGVRRRANPAISGGGGGVPNGNGVGRGGSMDTGSGARPGEEIITVTLERKPGRHLGIRCHIFERNFEI